MITLIGAGTFGAMIGWYVYYINRYRKSDVQLGDITTLVGVLGGGAATALFAPGGELFGAYGIGLFVGFFGYFVSLMYLVERSANFDADWFLDGRRKRPEEPYYIPGDVAPTVHPMALQPLPRPAPAALPGMAIEPTLRQAHPPEEMTVAAQAPRQLPAPMGEAAPMPEAAAAPELSQASIDACVAIRVSKASDIAAHFAGDGGFIAWYNRTLSSHPAFSRRGKIPATDIVKRRFDAFWDQIPSVFGTAEITMVEFCALMSIGIQENSGDLWANPEKVGNAGHPGLAYAFDRIPNLKQSYNHANGNWTALKLFGDASYLSAHRTLPGADRVLQNGVSQAWAGESWPGGFPTAADASVNGFVMEADFFKFRGRGIIQTTGRADYNPLIEFILNDAEARANPALAALASAWRQAGQGASDPVNVMANVSTNRQWDAAFAEALVLAAGIRIDSTSKGHYLDLSHQRAVLNAGVSTKGSLFFLARKINGGSYPDQVVPMMRAMIQAVAQVATPSADLRMPRELAEASPEPDSVIRPSDVKPWEELTPNSLDDEGVEPEGEFTPLGAVPPRWRVAKSLLTLRDQINRLAPNRKKGNDGTIGDESHQTRDSDHNAWVRDGAVGVVTALDITNDPANGCDAGRLAEILRSSHDSRIKYVIWNRRIANHAAIGGSAAWEWRPYHGSNPHDHHFHLSVKPERASYDSTEAWSITPSA
jgi:hypothetical protein